MNILERYIRGESTIEQVLADTRTHEAFGVMYGYLRSVATTEKLMRIVNEYTVRDTQLTGDSEAREFNLRTCLREFMSNREGKQILHG